ncbi:MAG: LOG family protein [Marinilabiliales bacterium]|nr:LOG family protein [Marinilabiliales bacterium]
MVITGAGHGIMQAGHEGAGPEMSFGANIRLPWEQSANPVIREDKKLVTFKYFFTRKLIFIRHSDAIALFPGGFGTMDEGYEALTLMQTGKSQLMPLVLIDRPGGTYWKTWDKHVREHLLRDELISPDDLNLYQITDDPAKAVKWITRFYRNFHSTSVREGPVRDPAAAPAPAPRRIKGLNEDFADHHHRRADSRASTALPEEQRGRRSRGPAPASRSASTAATTAGSGRCWTF